MLLGLCSSVRKEGEFKVRLWCRRVELLRDSTTEIFLSILSSLLTSRNAVLFLKASFGGVSEAFQLLFS